MTTLTTSVLRRDGGTQSRAALNEDTVDAYAEFLRDGGSFRDPVVVFFDGTDYWLADGFHRVAAAEQANVEELPADVRQGTRRDAVLFACGANAAHGLPRTNADKRRAVETLLRDPEWSQWSDREIARTAAVSAPLVGKVRGELATVNGLQMPTTRKTADGRTMDTGNIGTKAKVEDSPPAVPIPIVDPYFSEYMPKHKEHELQALERGLVRMGRCMDPLTVWRGVLLDGHARLKICLAHGLPFKTIEAPDWIETKDEARLWMYENQMARRQISKWGYCEVLIKLAELHPEAAELLARDYA